MAREARAMLQRDLAAGIGKSESTVSKWENENYKQAPESSSIEQLAEVLNVSASWFFKPLDDDNQPVYYRSLVSEKKVLRDKARARLGFVEAIEVALSNYIEFPEVDIPDLSGDYDILEVRSEEIESIASEVRAHWGIEAGPISDVLLLMENIGAIVAVEEIGSIKLDGVSWWSSRTHRPYVLLAKDKKSGARRRFDAAHELAHLILHRNITREQHIKYFSLIEDQAMALAGAILLPAQDFLPEVYSLSLDSLARLKPKWGVSVGAMIKRLSNCSEITNEYERRLWQYYSQKGWRGNEPFEKEVRIEEPTNLAESIKMIVEEKEASAQKLLKEIGLSSEDVCQLCQLEDNFFDSSQGDLFSKKPVLRKNSTAANEYSENVLPFHRRDKK